MKAIFTGTITHGFGISQVADDATAASVVTAHLAGGVLAEAVEILDPSKLDPSVVPDAAGRQFLVFGKALGNGFEVYGPFAETSDAEEFGEENRVEDGEWQVFSIED